MKQLFMALLVACSTTSLPARAQDYSGLFMTLDDYKAAKLSYKDAKINADVAFHPKLVKVSGTEKHQFDKGQLYGFKDARNRVFRFYDNNSYQVVDTTHFEMYSRVVNITNGKERTKEKLYYFSTEPGAQVQLLTKENLKKAFPGNERFHVMLDMQFKTDRSLQRDILKDGASKVKQLYAVSLNNQGV